MVLMFLNGDGMRGGRLNGQLDGAPLLRAARSAAKYRYYSVGDRFPAMLATSDEGRSVLGEVYDVPMEVLRDNLIPNEPPELELGLIELEDGTACLATVLRPNLADSPELTDISDIGDWRAYRGIPVAD
ncbi:gamma-glutamylcyclotransferase [Nocardia sp. NEAU-G5]|uniref:Gamma-glutamylcyclotransferase n=1 Tax=Nocardia albiluteola TaxID=2842303 RepID=A0ABS6AX39_9NOCA|nr:gamma-glutamylcyclotransferase [Nocardia albiluteola]MBU3062631.1 gamma-glutamylcyclotransferase [Nocardia albiluteola]MBU3065535.1 gamma-glutamylcyclotransferase [Nocardia albiluteola]